jgi:hypothetical protein
MSRVKEPFWISEFPAAEGHHRRQLPRPLGQTWRAIRITGCGREQFSISAVADEARDRTPQEGHRRS